MIDRIIVENFKSLRKVDLSLGRLNLFIGTNASGKSNFLDALRVLQGIGNGFTIRETLDGKPQSASTAAWDGIRGGGAQALYVGSDQNDEVSFHAFGRLDGNPRRPWEFLIAFSPYSGRISRERFQATEVIYDSAQTSNYADHPVLYANYFSSKPGRPTDLQFERSRPALGQLAARPRGCLSRHAEFAANLTESLANIQHVDPSPRILQQYSTARDVPRMGDHGENFAALVRTISQDAKVNDAYLAWLRELRPEEVDSVGTLGGALGEPLFMLRENGKTFPAPVLSDGTLRFAAIVAAFFQPAMPSIMTIEEIENGVHASRLRALVELLRSQSEHRKVQVFATTHSPTTLEWLHESEYRTTFLCSRDESTGESTIRPLSDVPHFAEVVKKAPLADLLAEGWLEMAL